MSPSPWSVDFWLDPACPLTRNTARWITSIGRAVPLDVHWHVMSLSVLNEHRDDDPEGDPDGYLWVPARVAAAVATEHGGAALGALYDALWTEPDGSEREWIGDIGGALHRCGLPTALADSGFSTAYDQALRRSHRDGVARIEAERGTPILTLTSPGGDRRSFFGPVLAGVPSPDDAIGLWESVVLLVTVPAFRELTC